MKQHNCLNCGAQLTGVTPGESVTCTHCDSTFVVPAPNHAARNMAIGLAVLAVVGAGVTALGILAAGGAATVVAVESANNPPPAKKAWTSRPKPALPLSKLKDLEGFAGWRPLDAPGMMGTYNQFDPLVNMHWMEQTARAWTADAHLTRLDINGVRPDGSLDISARKNFEVGADFASQTLRDSAVQMAKVSETKVKSEFMLHIEEGELTGRVDDASSNDLKEAVPPSPLFGCTLPELMTAFLAGGLEERPAYGLTLMWIEPNSHREGYWRWTASSIKSGDSIKGPYLDPATCQPR